MNKRTLTDRTLRSLKSPVSGQTEIWDSKIPGFGVRVSSRGTKSFVLVYRLGGRTRRMTIGRYPTIPLAEARKKAHLALVEISDGVDPALVMTKPAKQNPLAVELLVEDYIEKYAKPRTRDWFETKRLLEREFIEHWRGRTIDAISKGDVITAIDGMVRRGVPGAANRAFAIVRRFFNWCVERDLIDRSPCDGLKTPAKIFARDRVLHDDEITSIWQAATKMDYPFGLLVKLLLLTGQRRGEVISMTWDALDFEQGLWSLPASNTKSGRAHEVPLTDPCMEILQSVPRIDNQLLFPARGKDHPISGFSKWKTRLDGLSGVDGWRLHDLRRTAATGMARFEVPPHVVERILNHTSGTFGGVAGVYNRFGYLPEMRDALEKWSEHVMSLQDQK